MTEGIKIPVQAQLDKGDLARTVADFTAQMNRVGQVIAQSNKMKFSPVDKAGLEDLKKVVAQFETLKKINPDLKRRLSATGQSGAGFHEVDWGRVYQGGVGANRVYNYTTAGTQYGGKLMAIPATQPGGGGGSGRPALPGGGGGGGGGGGTFPGQGVVNAGLNAAGPVGGVAARSINAGASGGFGAGLSTMLGGLAAFGVSKAIGSVMNKLGDAEQESIRYDTLKRSLGDVNVSFTVLRDSIRHAAAGMDTTFDEAQQLAQQFARMSNTGSGGAAGIHRELMVGGGLSRSLGLDLSAGTGLLATARQSRVTTDETGSKRLALLIGESVGKVGFAKADELLSTVTSFIGSQTRASLAPANVAGYLGSLSGMAGSGRAGLDVGNSASILGRANSAVMGGGAAGEAGNNFMLAALGRSTGLNPVQVRLLQQQGLFGSTASTFGKGSLYAQYSGNAMGGSGTTNMSRIIGSMKQQYGGNKDLMLSATASLLGLNETQAMALLTHGTGGNLGGIEGRLARTGVSLSSLNSNGIGALAKINGGSMSDLQAQAASLMGRTGADALSPDESKRLKDAMGGTDVEKMKDVLTQLTATRDQEKTEGSETRRSIAGVERVTQQFAATLIPVANTIRDAVVAMAAKIAPDSQFGKAAADLASIKAFDQVAAQSQADLNGFDAETEALRKKPGYAQMNPAARDAWERGRVLDRERKAAIAQRNMGYSGQYAGGADALMAALIQTESGGHHIDPATGRMLVNKDTGAAGITQVLPGTGTNPGFGVSPLQNNSEGEYRRFGRDYLSAMMQRYKGDQSRALGAYNWGPGNVDGAIGTYGDDWLQHAPPETQAYVRKILAQANAQPGSGAMGMTGAGAGRGSAEAYMTLIVRPQYENGKSAGPEQRVQAKINRPTPAGAHQ